MRNVRLAKIAAAFGLVGALAAGSAVAPAQAEGNWREGWCYEDEGLAVVVDYTAKPRESWPNSTGLIIRCIIGPEFDPNLLPQEQALAAAGVPYREMGGHVFPEGIGGWAYGHGTIDGWNMAVWNVVGCNTTNCFQWWVDMGQQGVGPVVVPQFRYDGQSGYGSSDTNPGLEAPEQEYFPEPAKTNYVQDSGQSGNAQQSEAQGNANPSASATPSGSPSPSTSPSISPQASPKTSSSPGQVYEQERRDSGQPSALRNGGGGSRVLAYVLGGLACLLVGGGAVYFFLKKRASS